MERMRSLADAASIAPPSAELCLIAGMILAQTRGKPAKLDAMVKGMREFVDAHQKMSGVLRLRGAEHDAAVLNSMAQAAEWLERIEPFLRMMSRR